MLYFETLLPVPSVSANPNPTTSMTDKSFWLTSHSDLGSEITAFQEKSPLFRYIKLAPLLQGQISVISPFWHPNTWYDLGALTLLCRALYKALLQTTLRFWKFCSLTFYCQMTLHRESQLCFMRTAVLLQLADTSFSLNSDPQSVIHILNRLQIITDTYTTEEHVIFL